MYMKYSDFIRSTGIYDYLKEDLKFQLIYQVTENLLHMHMTVQ